MGEFVLQIKTDTINTKIKEVFSQYFFVFVFAYLLMFGPHFVNLKLYKYLKILESL